MKDKFIEKLERLEKFVKNNKDIDGCLYVGSLSKGTYDNYSDYDIVLIVSGKNIKKIGKNVRQLQH